MELPSVKDLRRKQRQRGRPWRGGRGRGGAMVAAAGEDADEEMDQGHASIAFRQRHVQSNWDRYEEPSVEPSETMHGSSVAWPGGENFTEVLQRAGTAASHMTLDSYESAVPSGAGASSGGLQSVDLNAVLDSLYRLPVRVRLLLESDAENYIRSRMGPPIDECEGERQARHVSGAATDPKSASRSVAVTSQRKDAPCAGAATSAAPTAERKKAVRKGNGPFALDKEAAPLHWTIADDTPTVPGDAAPGKQHSHTSSGRPGTVREAPGARAAQPVLVNQQAAVAEPALVPGASIARPFIVAERSGAAQQTAPVMPSAALPGNSRGPLGAAKPAEKSLEDELDELLAL